MNGYDLIYILGLTASSPLWLPRKTSRAKVFEAMRQRMGKVEARTDQNAPAILIHAVSLGEINATPALVEQLRRHRPGLQFIVSVTTSSGYARGLTLYQNTSDVTLVKYPLDFSKAINRFLDAMRPTMIVLLELEIWPNFIRQCRLRKIPVALINGRVTESSFNKYYRARLALRPMFRALDLVAAQDQIYADRFAALGVNPEHVKITGTMKFDTAQISDGIVGQKQLADEVGLAANERVWVCGSTGPGEERLILEQYRKLQREFDHLRLVIVPRSDKRFDEVAELISAEGFDLLRRSGKPTKILPAGESKHHANEKIILGDTFGELRKFYALADVIFVGRSLVDLGHRQHGSDMIEAAALGKPVIVGPFTTNFADAMKHFLAEEAIRVAANGNLLGAAVREFLRDPALARKTGERAREIVRREQGATARNVELILQRLPNQ